MQIERIIYISKDRDDHLHCHENFHELHVGIEGQALFRSGLQTRPFRSGTVAYVPPGWQHQMQPRPRLGFFYILFAPQPEDIPLLERLNALSHKEAVLDIPEFSAARLARLHSTWMGGDRFSRTAAEAMLSGLVHETLQAAASASPLPDSVETAIRLMQNHVEETPSLEKLSAVTGMGVSTLMRTFSRHTGMPPHRFHNKLRCEHACYLLNHTDKPIKEIAADLGFCDAYHFSRVFRQFLGTPPATYRRQMMLVE